jgi:predicted aspartyl protease
VKFAFNPSIHLVFIQAEIYGPKGPALLRMALDRGATSTLINAGVFRSVGYDPAVADRHVQITTGSRVESAPRITIDRFAALVHEVNSFSVVCHTLPPTAGIDGVLGLDFLRGHLVTIDFRSGLVELS